MLNGLNPLFYRRFLFPLSVVFALGLVTFFVFSPYIPDSFSYQIGDISKDTIFSPRYIEFESQINKYQNQFQKDLIKKKVGRIYTVSEEKKPEILDQIMLFYGDLKKNKNIADIKKKYPFMPPQFLIANMSSNEIQSLEYITKETISKIFDTGINTTNKPEIRLILYNALLNLDMKQEEKDMIVNAIIFHVHPYLFYNEKQSQLLFSKALSEFVPVSTIYKEGQPILYRGERVTSKHVETLKALNMYGVSANFLKFFGLLLLTALLFLAIDRCLYFFFFKLYEKQNTVMLILLVFSLILLISKSMQHWLILHPIMNIGFLMPVALGTLIFSLLLSPTLGIFLGTIICIFCVIMLKGDFFLFIYFFLGTLSACFSNINHQFRKQLLLSGFITGGIHILTIVGIGFFKEINNVLWYLSNGFLGLVNGIIVVMISLSVLPYLEWIFGITTRHSLIELANLNHPLLKKLMVMTPGTYQHSVMVANLAEAAAEAVGGDVIICRVGAYFHDIGKTKRPLFFVENQFSSENPHKTLSPRLSKLIIAAHVKEGSEMAKTYKLPSVLIDIIQQHHGTTLVSFFYNQALTNEEDPDSLEQEFRYPGPKPQFRESGILMLADSVEAAVKSLENPTPVKIEWMIHKIIWEKLSDNQLSDCDLTLKEIDLIKTAFKNVFLGLSHHRLDYDDEIEKMTHAL